MLYIHIHLHDHGAIKLLILIGQNILSNNEIEYAVT